MLIICKLGEECFNFMEVTKSWDGDIISVVVFCIVNLKQYPLPKYYRKVEGYK